MAGIYIHVPFCKTRCIYCDFYSTTQSQCIGEYTMALCRELESRKEYLKGEPVQTIYFGGGTPSQLSADFFEQIFEIISRVYGMNECVEITLEANPDDLTNEYLTSISHLPFNRISIGIQTFNDDTLKLLNRRHNSRQALTAVTNSREAGFRNISIDLMYGLPGQSLADWETDLERAININVEHISAYHLTYEKDTVLYKMLRDKVLESVDEETSNLFFSTLIRKLSGAGFEHYEISNFCRSGFPSKHNSSYWDGITYLGCGPSAHSYKGDSREWNTSSLAKYIKGINGGCPVIEREELDINTKYNDLIVTALRTSKGLSLSLLQEEFGTEYLDYCYKNVRKHLEAGLVIIENDYLKLTTKGIFVSDGIMSDLLWV